MKNLPDEIAYQMPLPFSPSPIVVIGSGGIVQAAHLPAYRLAGFTVAGIFDIDREKAGSTAADFGIPVVYTGLSEMVAENRTGAVYDVAVPGGEVLNILKQLPDHSFVLIQKPMGENEAQAQAILELCRNKKMTTGVNFQLRYAPYILMAKNMISRGMLGDICDVEVYVNVYTPWQLWKFLYDAPRVEILYHSIHYMDLIRNLLGHPLDIYARTIRHPKMAGLHSVRSNIIMDYGDMIRANILTNHAHDFGLHNQDAYIKIEGTKGAVKIKMGSLMNYPTGIPDRFEYIIPEQSQGEWKQLPLNGSWFPHAFIGSMSEIMKAKAGEIAMPDNSVEDCIHTMRCVEAAYNSASRLSSEPVI